MKEKFKNKIIEYTSIIRTVVPVTLVFVIVFGFFLANCNVPTASMDPAIPASSRVIANRVAYKNHDVQREDIIVFDYPDNSKTNFTKRVIGLPGDVVSVIDGNTYINGKQIKEDYLANDHTGNYGPFYVPKAGDEVTIKDAEYDKDNNLIAGTCYIGKYPVGSVDAVTQFDANGQIDSKEPGFIAKYCTQKEDGKYYVTEDTYFCMGDNRDNSHDARFWSNKYVTKEMIIGKMIFNVSDFSKVK